MRFDQREWVNEIVVTTLTGIVGGGVAVLFAPDAPVGLTISAGGTAGLVTGLLNLPLKWLVSRRPPPDEGQQGEPPGRKDDNNA